MTYTKEEIEEMKAWFGITGTPEERKSAIEIVDDKPVVEIPSRARLVLKKINLLGAPLDSRFDSVRIEVRNDFDNKYLHSMGNVVYKKTMFLPEQDIAMTIMVWNANPRKRHILELYKGASGALAIIANSRPDTQRELEQQIQDFYSVVGKQPMVFLAPTNMVYEEDLKQLAEKYDATYHTAKSFRVAREAFRDLANLIIAHDKSRGML